MIRTAKIIKRISYLTSAISFGTLLGLILLWDEIETLPNYNTFVWQIDKDINIFYITFAISFFSLAATSLYLQLIK